MSVRAWNATLNQSTVVDYDGSGSNSNKYQTQGFNTSADIFLGGFAFFVVSATQGSQQLWIIRNNSYSDTGPIIAAIPVTPAGPNKWVNVTFPTPIYLTKGHYYVCSPNLGNPGWGQTNNGITGDAYFSNNNKTWSPEPWNYTLKLFEMNVISPIAVGMNVSGEPVG